MGQLYRNIENIESRKTIFRSGRFKNLGLIEATDLLRIATPLEVPGSLVILLNAFNLLHLLQYSEEYFVDIPTAPTDV